MAEKLKLITLNVEGDRHLETFLAAFKVFQPAIVCFQEMFEVDIPQVMEELEMTSVKYVPTMTVTNPDNKVGFTPKGNWGVAIMTKLEVKKWEVFYYSESTEVKEFKEPNDSARALIVGTLIDGQQEYRVATTHFTWSSEGQATDLQREDFVRLQEILKQFPDLILCGDFNAPRGREIFSKFEELYHDNVPPETTTTIDSSKHYSGKVIELVVDSIFTTPHYKVSDVQVISGVSDHMAISGLVERV